MISYLEGELLLKLDDSIILMVNGIGYKVYTTRYIESSPIRLFAYQHVSSDNQTSLYGVNTIDQLNIFELLLKVSGVGPKIAHRIIESSHESDLKRAVADGDINFFTRVKGLGKKNAQKIVLELKNTLVEPIDQLDNLPVQALLSLGFSQTEIDKTMKAIDTRGLRVEEIVELALKNIKSI